MVKEENEDQPVRGYVVTPLPFSVQFLVIVDCVLSSRVMEDQLDLQAPVEPKENRY